MTLCKPISRNKLQCVQYVIMSCGEVEDDCKYETYRFTLLLFRSVKQ